MRRRDTSPLQGDLCRRSTLKGHTYFLPLLSWPPKRTVWKEGQGRFRWRSHSRNTAWSSARDGTGPVRRLCCQEAPLINAMAVSLQASALQVGVQSLVRRVAGGVWGQSPSPSFWISSFQLFPLRSLRLRLWLHCPSHQGLNAKQSESPKQRRRERVKNCSKETMTENPQKLAKDTNLLIQELNEPQITETQWNPSQDVSESNLWKTNTKMPSCDTRGEKQREQWWISHYEPCCSRRGYNIV